MPADPGFDACFARCFRLAYQVAYRICASGPDAEDIAQEAMTRALVRWSSIAQYPEAWVSTVAFRLAIDFLRKTKRHLQDLSKDDSDAFALADQRMDLYRALKHLSRRQQQVVACRYLAGLSDDETASMLRMSTGSVKKHSARALQTLRMQERESSSKGASDA